ncbi:MAG: class I SAM-dependent methyltransferase [Leptolyngbya sp.]|nr:class I SAM-dependent methyltransferase [Candidatus Melainabacteria bacterium]
MSVVKRFELRRQRNLHTAAPPRRRRRKVSDFRSLDVMSASVEVSTAVTLKTDVTTFSYPSVYETKSRFIGRLKYNEGMAKSHFQLAASVSFEGRHHASSDDLKVLVSPALKSWMQGRKNLHVVELGPSYTTVIPEALEQYLGSYTAVDFSGPLLDRQMGFLKRLPGLANCCTKIVSDTFDLVLPPSSIDLVVTSCHPPLVSAPVTDCIQVIKTVHEILKPGEFFAVFPWIFSEQAPSVNRLLLTKFALKRVAFRRGLDERLLLLLQKV